VNLALPAHCVSTPAKALQCQDVAALNTLDGFNIQPRLTIPFSGPIDVSSVRSRTSCWSSTRAMRWS